MEGLAQERTGLKSNKLSTVFVCRGLCIALFNVPCTFLQKGDIITVLKKQDNGKWFGQLGDRTGYFQFNYVESIPQSENPD